MGDERCSILTSIIFSSTNDDKKIIEVKMRLAHIHTDDIDIEQRLELFDISRAELLSIVRAVVSGRADAVSDDPLTAEGLFAYIYGTRATRQLFRPKGWTRHRRENIESVKHPTKTLQIVYQSVDLACSLLHDPKAVSGKGSGTNRVIDSAQGSLFDVDDLALPQPTGQVYDGGVWFLCVSVDGDDVRAELSLPTRIGAGNFDGFLERIFIVRDGEWSNVDFISDNGPAPAEFEPLITRKS